MLMVFISRTGHWKPARSEPELITRGKRKGKFRVDVFTGNPENPQGLTRVIVNREDLKEVSRRTQNEPETPPHIKKMQKAAKLAVKYGNGLKQSQLFKKPEQRNLF